MRRRCVQWAEIDGHRHHIVGGKLANAVKNPTWNPIAKPGAPGNGGSSFNAIQRMGSSGNDQNG